MKKTKLLSSILALCCSLLALSFGVYAAVKQVDYTINGSLSYEVTDAYVDITTKVFTTSAKASTRADLKTMADNFLNKEISNTMVSSLTLESTSYEVTNLSAYNDVLDYNSQTDTSLPTTQIDLAYSTQTGAEALTYFIVINIQNLASNNVYAQVTKQDITGQANSLLYITSGFSTISNTDTTKNIVFAFSINDLTESVLDVEFNYQIDIVQGDYTSPLKLSSDNSYYYIPLGKIGDTEVEWKLISIDDGVSAYTTDATTVPVGTGVFILNTVNDTFKMVYDNNHVMDYYSGTDTSKHLQTEWADVYANDYSASSIRRYLNGVDIHKTTNSTLVEGLIYNITPNTSSSASNMLSELSILTNTTYKAIYDKIIARSLTDLYQDAYWHLELSTTSYSYQIGTPVNVEGLEDKFWLFSTAEISNLLNGQLDYDSTSTSDSYWLRSSAWYPNMQYVVSGGDLLSENSATYVSYSNYCRAGFKLQV